MSQIARAEGPDAIAGVVDPVWTRLRQEAEVAIRQEPSMTGFVVTTILNHPTLESAVAHRVASRLGHPVMSDDLIFQTFLEATEADATIGEAFRADIAAVADRDPACTRLIEPVLYFKGFTPFRRIVSPIGCGRAAGRISRFISRAAPRKCSRSTSIRRCGWGRASSSTTRLASSSARRRSSTTTSPSCRT